VLIINDYFELLLPPCAYLRDACREELPRRNAGAGTLLPGAYAGLTALHRVAPAGSHLQAFRAIPLWDAWMEKWHGCGQPQPLTGHRRQRV